MINIYCLLSYCDYYCRDGYVSDCVVDVDYAYMMMVMMVMMIIMAVRRSSSRRGRRSRRSRSMNMNLLPNSLQVLRGLVGSYFLGNTLECIHHGRQGI